MKITDRPNTEHIEGSSGPKSGSVKKRGQVGASKPTDSVDRAGELASAKVKLSERAQDMKKIRSAVDSAPDVNEEKIAKFKGLINSGNYKVDAKAVADKMVDEHSYNDFLTEE
jgi:negative regulator of flagellin synthesis FlgM